jgi:hypothetical protein
MNERLPRLAMHVFRVFAHKGQPPKFSPPKPESPIIPNPWKALRSRKAQIESDFAKRPSLTPRSGFVE